LFALSKPAMKLAPFVAERQPKSIQTQSGSHNIQTGPIIPAPCSTVQVGGNSNQANVNCTAVRRLTPAEKAQLIENLRQAPPGTVTVWAVETGQSLAGDIYDALKQAGWSMQDPDVQTMFLGARMREDIDVFIHADPGETGNFTTHDPTTVNLMRSLRGLTRFTSELGRSTTVNKDTIKVSVGPPS